MLPAMLNDMEHYQYTIHDVQLNMQSVTHTNGDGVFHIHVRRDCAVIPMACFLSLQKEVGP